MEESNLSNKVSARVETITPDLAREYLKANINNRILKSKVVDFYAEQMRKGQWLLNGEAICFTEGGGMVNGQHRLNAVIKAGIPVDIIVVRGCDPNSFNTYDSGVNRTCSDIFYLNGISNNANISAIVNRYFTIKADRLFISAANAGRPTRTKELKKSKTDALNEYLSSPSLYQDVYRLSDSCTSKIKLYSRSEIGGFCAFLVKDRHHSLEVVTRFMRMLFWNEDVTNNTVNVLREKILKDRMSTKSVMTSSYKQAILIKTWNAYITRKELKTLTYNKDKEGNLVIL